MTYIRAIAACGVFGVLLAGGWFTAVGLTLGTAPQVQSDQEFVADPTQQVFHDPAAHCIYLPPKPNKELLHFRGQEKAKEFAPPCPHCLSELARKSPPASLARRP